ncbi:uncharacterized protein EV154DRAFT_555422 [Mucor mucedo]|uniref:uncharacterized protein n=1 Tax=Mucor mucedo TaxID=29922 RepID=UPI00221F79B3|nr:uncharacterized protein EV154DRAFT_555422 [Mucor mucedo]KAI7879211.1 hypothetical protein EV154DRAFT_555422 [Mucor mucedo]
MNKKNDMRVILDEAQLYVEETSGSVMVRGEVIVNFTKDTPIQGPIELLFEGIQRYQTWAELVNKDKAGSPIETKLQVTELSLLPPNSKGFMPSGVQRFPFEFPIPSTLPTSVYIPDRLEIFYQLTATLRLSKAKQLEATNTNNWIEWALRNSSKKKYVATSPIRIIRAMESVVSHGLPTSDAHDSTPSLSAVITQIEDDNRSSVEVPTSNGIEAPTEPVGEVNQLPWNRRGLDAYQGSLDEQHDQLAFSLSGRTSGNFNQPIHMLEETQGVRYKLGVDRTAIAIGTSIGIELMIEPTFADARIKSVLLKVSENRKYTLQIPSDHAYSTASEYQTKTYNEGAKMVMKWAFGYEVENDEGEMVQDKKNIVRQISKPGDKYIRERSSSSQFLAHFDPPPLGHVDNKFFLGNHPDNKPTVYLDNEEDVQENNNIGSSSVALTASKNNDLHDILNLKELDQSVRVGEYFGGRFVMPIPDCTSLLNPSMEYDSINISHWLQLVVAIECNGKEFELRLDSPSRMLDCRVVSVDDAGQTILPPPPSYEPGDGFIVNDWSTGTFWEQREPITSVSNWGSKVLCPCESKKKLALDKNKAFAASGKHHNTKKNKMAIIPTPPNLLPEWGPPPAYNN